MNVYKYNNYTEYLKSQKAAFKKKFNNVWAIEENIKAIADYLLQLSYVQLKSSPKIGICHGVRQGLEVDWFIKYLGTYQIYGTDIGKVSHPHVFQWDFNIPNDKWRNHFDFVYSNSFDHAYNPPQTFQAWCNQLRPGGHLILEYDRRQEHTGEISMKYNKTDPVSIRLSELVQIIPEWNYKASVIDILNMPIVTQEWRKAIIIEVK